MIISQPKMPSPSFPYHLPGRRRCVKRDGMIRRKIKLKIKTATFGEFVRYMAVKLDLRIISMQPAVGGRNADDSTCTRATLNCRCRNRTKGICCHTIHLDRHPINFDWVMLTQYSSCSNPIPIRDHPPLPSAQWAE